MAQPLSSQQQHSQLPPEYRQALLQQQQQQQQLPQNQQQAHQQPKVPTIQDIEQKYSQLPPQYRQAVLEKQQRELQMQLQQPQQPQQPQQQPQQQQQRQQQQRQPLRPEQSRNKSVSLASSPSGGAAASSRMGTAGNLNNVHGGVWSSTRQRNASAPLTGTNTSEYRFDRDNDSLSTNSSSITGPGRAHWKPDSTTNVCTWPGCRLEFGLFDRRHHCRKCGDIFCSTHCSKEIPLDQSLDFNPSEGCLSRACVGCYEAYEQWQGLIPSGRNTSHSSNFGSTMTTRTLGTSGNSGIGGDSGSSNIHLSPGSKTSSTTTKPNVGHIPDGFLGGESTREAIGREDIVRQQTRSPTGSSNIAIKQQPSTDEMVLPMPSVPHDWSWSTF